MVAVCRAACCMEEGPGLWGEDVVALRRAEMWVVGWTACVTLGWGTDSQVVSWERLGVGDMALVLWQSRLRWCGHVLQGDDGGWVGGCVECEVCLLYTSPSPRD